MISSRWYMLSEASQWQKVCSFLALSRFTLRRCPRLDLHYLRNCSFKGEDTNNHYSIDRNRKLGDGGFEEVFIATRKEDGESGVCAPYQVIAKKKNAWLHPSTIVATRRAGGYRRLSLRSWPRRPSSVLETFNKYFSPLTHICCGNRVKNKCSRKSSTLSPIMARTSFLGVGVPSSRDRVYA